MSNFFYIYFRPVQYALEQRAQRQEVQRRRKTHFKKRQEKTS